MNTAAKFLKNPCYSLVEITANECVQFEVKRRTDHPVLVTRALSRPNCMTDHQSTTTYEYNTYIVLPLRKDKRSALNCVPRRT